MPAVSKHALTFHNRVLSFGQDIELVDIICKAQKENDFLHDESKLFRYLDADRHVLLSKRKAVKTSRNIVVMHLRKTMYSAYIKDIFEELTTYLKSLIYEAALLGKNKETATLLLGEQKLSVTAADILRYDNLDQLIKRIAEDMIRELEKPRNTRGLISNVCNKLNLAINNQTIENALPYLELRHKLVHADGVVDNIFMNRYKMFTYKDSSIVLNYKTLIDAKKNITALVADIDLAAIEKGVLKPNTQ